MQGAGAVNTLPLRCNFCALQVNYTASAHEVKNKLKTESLKRIKKRSGTAEKHPLCRCLFPDSF